MHFVANSVQQSRFTLQKSTNQNRETSKTQSQTLDGHQVFANTESMLDACCHGSDLTTPERKRK
jgi:hypothetical protein